MLSEEQWDYVGDCEDCGSPIYQLTQGPFKGQLWSKNPAPDCNCWIKEDETEEREDLIKNIIKGQEEEGEDAP